MVLMGLKRGSETGAGESFNMMTLPAGITSRVWPPRMPALHPRDCNGQVD
jgi:hypothetical protein